MAAFTIPEFRRWSALQQLAARSDVPPRSSDGYGGMAEQLELLAALPGPAIVVFQDVDDPPVAQLWRSDVLDVQSFRAPTGLITSGDQARFGTSAGVNYPVFTGSTIVSHGYNHMCTSAWPCTSAV